MPQHVPIRAGAAAVPAGVEVGLRDKHDHDAGVREERRGIEEEERREAFWRVRRGDETSRQGAETDAEVHHDALHGEGRRTLIRGREARDERRLGWPEASDSDATHDRDEKALPRHVDEGVARIADREDHQRERQHPLSTEAVDLGSEDRAGDDAHDRVRRDDQPCHPELDPANVV